jgi:hypothetical protein
MTHRIRFALVALGLVTAAGACSIFEDQSPENISLRMTGSSGQQVQAVYSTRFIAGLTEEGVTEVQIFDSDTVMQTLPIDTIVNIAENMQFFVEILPMGTDTLDVAVDVEIDGRGVLESSGLIFPTVPWRYVYQFNQLLSDVVEVVI